MTSTGAPATEPAATNPPPPGRECPDVIRDGDGTWHSCARWSSHLGIHRTASGRPEWLDDGTFIRQGAL